MLLLPGYARSSAFIRNNYGTGSRRKPVTEARVRIIEELVNESGASLTEVTSLIGISPSGVGNVLKRLQADR